MATFAILQSPVELPGSFNSHMQAPRKMPREQRPKLSLDTKPHRSFGRASTGLRLDTLSATSPTRTNTYRNSYDPQGQSLPKAASTPLSHSQPQLLNGQRSASAAVVEMSGTTVPLSSDNPIKTPSEPPPIPYSLPADGRSILTNGPFGKRQRTAQTPLTATSPPTFSARHFAPPKKRVCFRDPVSENIQTTRYLFRHSDIRSRSVSPAPRAPGSAGTNSASSETKSSPLPPKAREIAPKGQQLADDEDEENELDGDGERGIILPKTPMAGRNKKERKWAWTLGPLPGIAIKGPGSSIPANESPDEDLDDSLGETVAAASGFLSQDRGEYLDEL